MDDATCSAAPPHQPRKLESPTEILPTMAVKEDLLDIKDEPVILHDQVVSEDDRDEYNTGNDDIHLKDGSDEDLRTLCKEETVRNITATVHHNTASPDSGMQLSLKMKPSSPSNCKIFSVHQSSRDTVKRRMYKKGNTSTVQNPKIQTRFDETISRNNPVLQHESLNTPGIALRCSGIKLNSCDTCHNSFSSPYNLKRHKRIHTGENPYTCDTCHKTFSRLFDLERHKRVHTGSKPYTCVTCHKCFSDSSILKNHTRIHSKSKLFTCDTCQKCFYRISDLNSHTRIHIGSKPHTCDTCHKFFRCLSQLETHTRIHTGSKPYTCDTCHKCFSDSSSLKKHTRIHSGIKPYTCDECHKSFSDSSNLKTHAIIHTGNKPYTCDICHKCFNRLSNLKTHITKSHRNKLFISDTLP